MATRAQIMLVPEVREWFTADELAEMNLPGLPGDKRSINRRAKQEGWKTRCDRKTGELLARPARNKRGGGLEYHVSLLPGQAQIALAERGITHPAADAPGFDPHADAWRWFDAQKDSVKAEAERRLTIVRDVELLVRSGLTRTAANAETAARHGVSVGTIANYLKAVRGVAPAHQLPALAPRYQGGGVEADIHPDLWHLFRSDWLRPEEPTLSLCYEEVARKAAEMGLSLPSERTFRRRLERELDPRIIRRLRKGKEADAQSRPAQRRSVDHLHALECVNIDGHKCDVRVLSPWKRDKNGKPLVIRPILLGLQDVRSSKVVAWRVCEVESAHYVRLVFADLFEKWGIPLHCVLDNGRGFASKWITGGVKNRFRFKVKAEDPLGLITRFKIQHHWALPYHGQSKPIERAWRDLTNRIARHSFCAGAYTGNSPVNKPDNYGTREVPWDDFVAHVDRQIALHNAKLGRKGRDYKGRSFDQVFAETYETAPITKEATAEQLRFALLAAENRLVNKKNGEVELFGNRYWSEGCSQIHGERVTVRFDPDDLTKDVHLYALDGRYLTSAKRWADVGFLDAESAKKTAKFNAEQRRKVREGIEAEDLLSSAQVAAHYGSVPTAEEPEAKVVRIARTRGNAALKLDADAPQLPSGENKILNLFGRLRPED
ncbi:transposase domain-containing protein [Novosphingobium naphthalenivorans]|uniref:transposase domain-containing protein n=1 Tax=Novosphingobium naphthalenivorans TaxID=273168 RepID=UPI000830853F|nr:transposase domain-containing protein [Novosphingobium naphthalenivorans]